MQRGDAQADPNTFSLRPQPHKKFKPHEVKAEVRKILVQKLEGQEYNPDNIQNISKEIADSVRDRVRSMEYDRYKLVVNCVIGEQRGEGLRLGCRCFWDSDSDNYAEEVFTNKQLFAVVTVFGLYQY
jgi:hypothetical protein